MFRYHYFPLAPLFFLGLILLLGLAIVLIELRILRHAYTKMGVSRRWMYSILVLCLIGSS